MSFDRIQKLLFGEYVDFVEMVLLESPFVETTKSGIGLRQIQLGITPTKLIIASDVIVSATEFTPYFFEGRLDTNIENFELISIYPIEMVSLSIYKRKKRQVIKALYNIPDNISRITFYELGGHSKRTMFWNLWREKIKFLNPHQKSPTNTSSSSFNSATPKVLTKIIDDQIWHHYGTTEAYQLKWTEKDLYFGSKLEVVPPLTSLKIFPIFAHDSSDINVIYKCEDFTHSKSSILSENVKRDEVEKGGLINRFGEGIDENCNTALYLPPASQTNKRPKSPNINNTIKKNQNSTHIEKGEAEINIPVKPFQNYFRAISCLHAIHLSSSPTEFVRETKSLVYIDEDKSKVEQVGLTQLTCSISHESFRPAVRNYNLDKTNLQSHYFWTPDFWFHPENSSLSYILRLLLLRHAVRNKCKSKKCCKSARSSSVSVALNLGRERWKQKTMYTCWNSIWDFDSFILGDQLTLIDAKFFLNITLQEWDIVTKHSFPQDAVNLVTWLVFGERCVNLFISEIVKCNDLKKRAKLLAKLIKIAQHCHNIRNFHSCNNILTSLLSPPVRRLKETWSVVRQSYETRYKNFETLSHLYNDTASSKYKDTFEQSDNSPFIPSVSHLFQMFYKQIRNSKRALLTNNLNETLKLTRKKSSCNIGLLYSKIPFHKLRTDEYDEVHFDERQENDLESLDDESEAFFNFFKAAQEAAISYDFQEQNQVKDYLLKAPYFDQSTSFSKSMEIEFQ